MIALALLAVFLSPPDTVHLSLAPLYTAEAEAEAMSRGTSIEADIAEAVADFQAVVDSATVGRDPIRIRAFAPRLLAFTETGACQSDTQTFAASETARSHRSALAANVAVLFTARCSGAIQCEQGAECETTAFALAQARTAGPVAHALAHEVGHLLGMRHDVGSDPAGTFNHAYRDEASGFFTVLAQRGPLPRDAIVGYYSDPRRTLSGQPLGVDGVADNARQLALMAPVAATWTGWTVSTDAAPPPLPPLRAWPNPTTIGWTIDTGAPTQWELVDVRGRLVREGTSLGPTVRLDAARLAPGVYVLWVTDGQHTPRTIRLVRR